MAIETITSYARLTLANFRQTPQWSSLSALHYFLSLLNLSFWHQTFPITCAKTCLTCLLFIQHLFWWKPCKWFCVHNYKQGMQKRLDKGRVPPRL